MGYFKTLFVEALDGFVEHESTPSAKEMLAVALDGDKDTLEEHDKKYHPDGYKEGDECKYREKEKAKDDADVAETDNGGKNVSPYVKSKGGPALFRVGDSDRLGWTSGWMAEEGEAERRTPSGGKWAYLMLENPLSLMDGYDDNGEEDEGREKDFKVKAFCDVMEKAGVKIDRELIKANFNASENPTIDNLIAEVGKKEFEEALKKLGYDGYVWDYDDRRVTAFDKEKVVPKDGERKEKGEEGKKKQLVTPEEDAAYMEAVKRGDVETAQKMVFATAKKYYGDSLIADPAGNPVVFYHGSKDKHNVFDPRKDKNGFGDVYFTDNFEYAKRFGDEVQSVILVAENPSEHDFSKEGFSNAVMSRYSGHDAAFVYGVMDFTGIKHGEVLMRKMENIKSADPVTYDDQGNIIPLSRRFDKGDDIRGDVTSSHKKGTTMAQVEEKKEEQKESSERGLEKTLSEIGINIYRPAIAEMIREVAGEIPESLIAATEQFDREVEGMKKGEKSYSDVREAYSRLKSACNGVSWAKDILKLASKVTKACAKEDIDAE